MDNFTHRYVFSLLPVVSNGQFSQSFFFSNSLGVHNLDHTHSLVSIHSYCSSGERIQGGEVRWSSMVAVTYTMHDVM